MIDKCLSIIAPHHCLLCNLSGDLLCSSCKYDIVNEPYEGCILCSKPTSDNNICSNCKVPYNKAWIVGERTDTLSQLVNIYKFFSTKSAHRDIASLLDLRLPELPKSTVVVPVPTIRRHVRERGYDHTLLFSDRFSHMRNLELQQAISRKTNTKQLGSSRKLRINQAKQAFEVNKQLDPNRPYLLIDDVITTGATIHYATKALLASGAKNVWVAIIAIQPLD